MTAPTNKPTPTAAELREHAKVVRLNASKPPTPLSRAADALEACAAAMDRVAVLEAALLELRDAANESHAPGERGVQGRLRALAAIERTNALLQNTEQQEGGA